LKITSPVPPGVRAPAVPTANISGITTFTVTPSYFSPKSVTLVRRSADGGTDYDIVNCTNKKGATTYSTWTCIFNTALLSNGIYNFYAIAKSENVKTDYMRVNVANAVTTEGAKCNSDDACGGLLCKSSGRYAEEKYCCPATKCAAAAPYTDALNPINFSGSKRNGHCIQPGYYDLVFSAENPLVEVTLQCLLVGSYATN
jgi:hypothetical protein